jgi:catechol 2,3-dioxygenase-like lactoylglutathione lyase family enzyme
MDQRVSIITLGVPDVAAARRFYVDGLGWTPTMDLPEVVFVQVAPSVLLALWGAADLEADAADGTPATPGDASRTPMALAHNVGSDEEVEQTVERVLAAGGTLVRAPKVAIFGGLSAYVADPAGFRWEIAHNPGWAVAPDGTVKIS